MEEQLSKKDEWIKFLMKAVLFLYPLRHIFHGVDLWDTGYNYANFTYIENMDPMWYFSTYLANIVGNLFTKLPLGDTYLGLNLYTGLTTSILAVLGFWFCAEVLKIPKWIVFAGEFLAVCLSWCPTALLYNYLTYILLGVAVILLYFALAEETKFSKLFFILSGICLGLNIFVRFSNLAQASMILAVWAMAIIRKEKFGKVVSQTLICLLGYLLGFGIGLAYVAARDGVGNYVNGIIRLMSMPSEASDYTVFSMIYGQIYNYAMNFKWILCLLALVIFGIFLFKVLPEKLRVLSVLIYGCGIVALFWWFAKVEMFRTTYDNLYSVFQWAVILLVVTHAIGIVVIFGKGFSEKDKLICGLNMLVVLVTPLGSNNQLFSAINNLYIAAPVSFWMLWRFLKWLPHKISMKQIQMSSMPIKLLLCAVIIMLSYQSVRFSIRYVFTEATGGKEHITNIESNDVLKWIKTDEEKAIALSQISQFVSENNLKGKECLLYGNIPSLSFYLEMPCVLSPWADLRSYNLVVMEEAMMKLQRDIDENGRECPIIILPRGTNFNNSNNKKEMLIQEMIVKYGYKAAYDNERFMVLMAEM